MLQGLEPGTPEMAIVAIPGDPPSKARPRVVSKNGITRTYTPARTVKGEKHIAKYLAHAGPYAGNVALACLFYRASYQRIDVDNLLKAVLDAATRAEVWKDDSQVTALVAVADYDPQCPRTIIALCPHTQTLLKRGVDAEVRCEACGKPFVPAGQRRETARWCSRECRMTLAEMVECPSCKQPFKRRTANQIYCSNECRGGARRTERPCARCGEQRAKRGSTLCRACFRLPASSTEATIVNRWAEGARMIDICRELGIPEMLLASRMAKMRKRGVDLPKRRP
jgi:Holliday junction resolvase RusA-like endonuclease/endogenous inhibitor of DNA gyrase (YacG/DUF329 family)